MDRRWEIVSSSGAFISVFFLWSFFWSFHARTDPASIKMAGRQRMLAVPLGHWAAMVALLGLQARSKSYGLHDMPACCTAIPVRSFRKYNKFKRLTNGKPSRPAGWVLHHGEKVGPIIECLKVQ